MARKLKCPIRHVIVESDKEVWFPGSLTTAMLLKQVTAKYFPGYTGKIASKEYFEELVDKYGN